MLQGQLIVVAAPSGAGKTSLVRAVLETLPDVVVSVSHTTRPARDGEIDGRHYHFIAQEKFESMMREGTLLEYAFVHGNYYGTTRNFVQRQLLSGKDVILEIDCQGACQVKKQFPEAMLVFILPPSMQALRERLKKRGQDDEAVITGRLQAAKEELAHFREFDYLVVNEDFEYAKIALCSIIQAGHLRTKLQQGAHAALLSDLLGEKVLKS